MQNILSSTTIFAKHANYSRRLLIVPATYPRHRGTTAKVDDKLQIALHDYRVHDSDAKGLTLFFTHGTSFNKDLWSIIIEHVLGRKELAGKVQRVVAIDAVTHGDSAVINHGKLGNQAYWPDNAYDILTVIETLGLCVPIIGVGHSFGGGILAHASLISPSTFSETIFVDPIAFVMPAQDQMAADMALRRRDRWTSLNDVQLAFAKNKGLADWHAEQRAIYAEKGTIEAFEAIEGDTSRILKTPKTLEAATYRAAPLPDLLNLLHKSRSKHHFILGGKSKVLNSDQRQSISELSPCSSEVVMLPDAGHLIPMTHPFELAEHIETILLKHVQSTNEQRKEHKL